MTGPRHHYTSLLLRHESSSDQVERQAIRNRLRMERRSTVMASITCHLAGDRSGADFHWEHYREASAVLLHLTEDPRYRVTNHIHRN